MDPTTRALMAAGSGGSAAQPLYVEDVFSTWLYTGNSSTQTITNGIDLAGEGGLVWIKNRQNAVSHALYDTERGATKFLSSNATTAEITASTSLTSFNNDGFTLGADGAYGYSNFAGYGNYASWTFRKAPGFFDVVTYTGTGSARTIAHNLGSVPGCIITKRVDSTSPWFFYHRSIGATLTADLSTTGTFLGASNVYNNTEPTSSVFTVGTNTNINASGGTYVAYLFAHDEQIFGENEDQSVIKCGSYTGTGSYQEINLGWEAQWVLIKKATDNNGALRNWHVFDTMRGATVDGVTYFLKPNTLDAASGFTVGGGPAAVGFNVNSGDNFNTSGETYIYIAIRRGPMKTPTSGTEVFALSIEASTDNASGFPVDSLWSAYREGASYNTLTYDRLRAIDGSRTLTTSSTAAESTTTPFALSLANNVGVTRNWGSLWIHRMFRRAPGFFDVVAYTGTGGGAQVPHNLGVKPDFIIVKSRTSGTANWWTTHINNNSNLALNTNAASGTYPNSLSRASSTDTTFLVTDTLGVDSANYTGHSYIAYLFGSLAGVSKCGGYTGTGTTLDIDCGFTAGARLVIIKRTDSTGSWYVWDTARGIVSGDDSYLLLNSTAAEVTNTDYIDPLSSGFQITSTAPAAINASGGSFIFLAVA